MWSWMQRRHPKPPRLGSVTRSRCFGFDHVGHGKVPSLLENVKLRAVPNTVLPAAQRSEGFEKMKGGKGSVTSPKSGKTWQPEKYHHLRCSHCVLLCFCNLLKVVPPRRV